MSLGGLLVMFDLSGVSAAPEESIPEPDADEMTIGPSVRTGDMYLQSSPPEYLIEGKTSSGYFGNVMIKLDFNGDGYDDLAVGQPRRYQVCIYDGKTQLEYPSLYETDATARWIISGSSYFGSDLATGDINGDGYDDLVASRAGYSGYDYLYYGGPSRDSQTSISMYDYGAYIYTYYYASKTVGVGDIDGDGYDDILTMSGGGSTSYSGVYIWYGSSSFSGYKSYSSADARIRGYYYMATGGIETGDMNGDGKDEIVFGSPYYSGGRVNVMISKGTGRPSGYLYVGSSYSTCDWATYIDSNSKYFSYNVDIEDINGDGYEDLFIASSPTQKIYVIDGSSSLDTDYIYLTSTSSYDRVLTSNSLSEFGSMAFGDFNNDGKTDMAAGGHSGKVFILDNYIINGTTGSINAESKANFTVHQPSGSRYFAYTGYYYYYYSYPHYKTLIFWDRNGDGYEDIFISDPQKTVSGAGSYAGCIYGVSPMDMAGLGDFTPPVGDLPDGKTFYAEYKPYEFSVVVWNNWAPTADSIGIEMEIGMEEVQIMWNADDGLMETHDPTDLIRVDIDNYQFIVDEINSQVELKFNLTFTLNLNYECELNLHVFATMAHLYFSDEAYMGKLRNTFMFVGELESYTYDETRGRGDPLPPGSWVPENTVVELTGMKLVYNGTEDFMTDFEEEPFYPSNELFHIETKSNLGDEATDMESSGTEFDIVIPARDKPMLVTFDTYAEGIPYDKILTGVPQFYVNVDIDTPTKPVGISIHADGFTDPQTIVDNDGELYVTWGPAGEYSSGLDHYEVKINGDDQTIFNVEETYTKIDVTDVNNVFVEVRAIDNVGHIGPWGMGSIMIDDKMLNFTNFRPSSDVWLNTMMPDVYITIDDYGGRAIIGSSVEYSLSYDGGVTYTDWIDAEQVLEAKVLDIRIKPNLMEGDTNYIMFRASDEAGNVKESEAYQIMVDTSSIEFGDLLIDGDTAWENSWIESGDVEVSIELTDLYSGVDTSTIEYRYTVRSRNDLDTTLWEPYEGSFSGGMVTLDDVMFEMGDHNFIQFRGRDMVGNAFSYSPAFNVWVNTMPVSMIESPEDGMEVLEGEVFVFDGTGSFDYDGDVLEYTWKDTWTNEEGTQEIILGEDEDDPLRFHAVLEPGTHSIILVLNDGIHEVVSHMVNVTVIAREVPIWMYSDLDSDGDGMDNLWEYIYHLPWDEGSEDNGGLELDPTGANDFDGDGFTDLQEYQKGTNPTNILDFPVDVGTGTERDESGIDWIIFALVLVAIIIVIFAIIFMLANYMIVKARIASNAEKEAKEQEVLIQKSLDGGGLQKLQALKAASEGKVVALPTGVPAYSQTLPPAEGAAEEQPPAQPMTAAPVGEPAPAEQPSPAPAPMEAQPVDASYGGYNPPAQ
ncbi:MAG: FG-GAP-like repeat-containing protein [Thermoplasmatota archaeon]